MTIGAKMLVMLSLGLQGGAASRPAIAQEVSTPAGRKADEALQTHGKPRGTSDEDYPALFLEGTDLPPDMRVVEDAKRRANPGDEEYRELGGLNSGYVIWMSRDPANQTIRRIVDARWVFPNEGAARAYLNARMRAHSEGLPLLDDAPLVGADSRAFQRSGPNPLVPELHDDAMIYLFRVGNVVVKFLYYSGGGRVPAEGGLAPLKVASYARKVVLRINPDFSAERAGNPGPDVNSDPPVPELVVQAAHVDAIRALKFSPDSRLLATASNDGTIKIWNLALGRLVRTLMGAGHPLYCLTFRGDGSVIAAGGNDRFVHLWDARSGMEVATLKGHMKYITAVAFSGSGEQLASGDSDGQVAIWDLRTNTPLRVIEHRGPPVPSRPGEAQEFGRDRGESGGPNSLAYSPNGKLLAVGSDTLARVYEAASGRVVHTFPFEGDEPGSRKLVFSPDGSQIAVEDAERAVHVIDTSNWREIHRHEGRLLGYRPPGDGLVTFDAEGVVARRDAGTAEVREKLCELAGTPRMFELSPDGDLLAHEQAGHSFQVRNARSGEEIRMFGSPLRPAADQSVGSEVKRLLVTWNPARTELASGGIDGVVRIWDLQRGGRPRNLGGLAGPISCLAYRSDGTALAAADHAGGIKVWDLSSGNQIAQPPDPGAARHAATALAFSPDGSVLAIGYSNGSISLGDLTRKAWVKSFRQSQPSIQRLMNFETLHLHEDNTPISGLAFSPDGKILLASNESFGTVSIFEVATGRLIVDGLTHPAYVRAMAVDPRTGLLAVSGGAAKVLSYQMTVQPRDNTIRLFGIQPGGSVAAGLAPISLARELLPLLDLVIERSSARPTGGFIGRLAVRSLGRLLSTPLATYWDKRSNGRLVGHRQLVHSLAFSPRGGLLASGGGDGVAKLWDTTTLKEKATLPGTSTDVGSVAFSQDGRLLACAAFDLSIRIWDVTSTECPALIATLVADADGYVTATPEGRFETDDLLAIRGFGWLFPDDPFRPIPPEVFLRDFFEPRLLPRVLARERLPDVRPLAELNRAQPEVDISEVRPTGKDGTVQVTVEVAEARTKFARGGGEVEMRSGVYDVRLFRDGQLVGRWPEPAAGDDALPEVESGSEADMVAWRAANQAKPDGRRAVAGPDGKLSVTFPVRLPREAGRKVEFTAYAFNEDRVKSATAGPVACAVPEGVPAKPRAYLVALGAEAFSDPAWDLRYAAADARLVLSELAAQLGGSGYEVAPVALVSPRDAARPDEAEATKAHLRAVLARLSGGPADEAARAAIPGYAALEPATPDDLVVVFASSHGYTDARGVFYLFPRDIGPPRPGASAYAVTPELLSLCVSSGELSAWLRGVDAGQLALVVDACHAAATVESPGFKPGPMGSRGLGQLAYDKAMRVLAASAADDVALEAEALGQGLLTYALVREGLQGRLAAKDGTLTLGGLLEYAVGRVPTLYGEVLAGAVKGPGGNPAAGVRVLVVQPTPAGDQGPALGARGRVVPLGGEGPPEGSTLRRPGAFQTPVLFDYARDRDVPLQPGLRRSAG